LPETDTKKGDATVRDARRTWAWRLLVLLGAAALALGAAACGDSDDSGGGTTGGGGGSAEVTLRVGYVTPAAHPYGQAIDFFAKRVGELSGGRLEIKTLPVYAGGNDLQLLDDVQAGSVDMGSVSAAVWGNKGVTSFEALQMPFLITRYDLESQVITGEIGESMLASPDGPSKIGLKGLAIHEGGLRKPLGAKTEIVSLADWKGKKIRSVESPVLVAGIRALGADATPLPIGDVYNALRSGTVDGMEANLGLVQTFKYYEVADYMTLNVNLWPFPTVLVVNQEKFDSLTAEQQQWITDAAKEVPQFSLGIFTDPANNLIPTLCDEGLKFAAATPQQLTQLTEATKPVYDEFANGSTGEYVQQIQALKDALPAPPAPAPLPEGCAAT
jgi:tripartite ATP-independent transporter DctP family solute receptor